MQIEQERIGSLPIDEWGRTFCCCNNWLPFPAFLHYSTMQCSTLDAMTFVDTMHVNTMMRTNAPYCDGGNADKCAIF